jgi:phage terminase small subunit
MTEQTGSALVELDGTELGPAMHALGTDRQRKFVRALFIVKQGKGRNVRAAKLAGYHGGNPNAWATIAHRLASDGRIQNAIREEQERHFVALGPAAIMALDSLIANPKHRDHGRAIGIVIDRLLPVTTIHKVETERRHVIVDPDKVLARIEAIARSVGLDVRKMPPTIEHETAARSAEPVATSPAQTEEPEGHDDGDNDD